MVEHPDGWLVFESVVVCQYLDDIFPQHRLTPADPYKKARDRPLVDICDKVSCGDDDEDDVGLGDAGDSVGNDDDDGGAPVAG